MRFIITQRRGETPSIADPKATAIARRGQWFDLWDTATGTHIWGECGPKGLQYLRRNQARLNSKAYLDGIL